MRDADLTPLTLIILTRADDADDARDARARKPANDFRLAADDIDHLSLTIHFRFDDAIIDGRLSTLFEYINIDYLPSYFIILTISPLSSTRYDLCHYRLSPIFAHFDGAQMTRDACV